MIKKISDMTDKDKEIFLEQVKKSMVAEHGVSWEFIEQKIYEDIDNTFDDEKFSKMEPDFQIDAAYARRAFGKEKPDLIDYLLWSLKFVTKSEYVEL